MHAIFYDMIKTKNLSGYLGPLKTLIPTCFTMCFKPSSTIKIKLYSPFLERYRETLKLQIPLNIVLYAPGTSSQVTLLGTV